MAGTMNNNLSGQLTLLKSALEGAGIAIGDALLPVVKTATEWINNLVDWFNNLSPSMQTTITIFGLVAAAIGPILLIVGNLCIALGGLITFFSAGGAGAGILSAAIGALGGPIGIAIGAIAALTAAGVAIDSNTMVIK
jgi:phage-related minor tail protein